MADEKLPAFEDTEELPSFEQTEELPSFEDTEDLTKATAQEREAGAEQARTKAAAVSGGLAAESLRRGVSQAGQYGLEKVGVLTPQQMKTISEAPEDYRKARSFSDLLEQFQELGQQTRGAGFEARRRGVESLTPLAPVRGTDIIPELGNISKAPVMRLSQEELPKIKRQSSKSVKDLENLLNEKQQLETKLANIQETGIESIERNKEINSLSQKINEVESKITKTIPSASKVPTEEIPPTIRDFTEATNIPEELLQARPDLANKKIQKEFGDILKKEIDFLKTGEISPKELANLVRQAQEKTSYGGVPSEVDKFKQEVARNYSEYLKGLEGAEG